MRESLLISARVIIFLSKRCSETNVPTIAKMLIKWMYLRKISVFMRWVRKILSGTSVKLSAKGYPKETMCGKKCFALYCERDVRKISC
jgi:hypothetical protein